MSTLSSPTAVKTLVVSAASRHGGTCEIADRIAETLQTLLPMNWHVVRKDLSDLRVLDDADAVVLGSATYYGHWMHSAARALDYLRDSCPEDLWLFSTGTISELETENAQITSANVMADHGEADEHAVFGGELDTSRLNLLERAMLRVVHALPGAHRDWETVDAWARHIASELITHPGQLRAAGRTGPAVETEA